MSVVRIENIEKENINIEPINKKTWQNKGVYYGRVNYKYKSGNKALNVIIKNLKLKRNLIDPFKPKSAGGYNVDKYESQRYKAIISIKDYPEIIKKLDLIDEVICESGEDESINFNLNEYVNNKGKQEINYTPIVKRPGMLAVRAYKAAMPEEAKKLTDEQIKEKLDIKIKPTLKVSKTDYNTPNDANTEIDCNIRYGEKITDINEDEVQGLDFYEKTFTAGCVVDIVLKINTWTSNAGMCTYGSKMYVSDITLVERPVKNVKGDLVCDDEEDIFAGTKKIEKKKKVESNEKPVEKKVKKIEFEEQEQQEVEVVKEEVVEDKAESEEEQKPQPKRIGRKKKPVIVDDDEI